MRKMWLTGVAVVALAGIVGAAALMRPPAVAAVETYEVPRATPAQLEEAAGLRVFFGHQSVGRNILDGLPAVYEEAQVAAPEIVTSTEPLAAEGPYLQEAAVGRNGDPLGKIEDFDRILRGGVADEVEVAAMKLCYVDFTPATDADALFAEYRATVEALERDYPHLAIVHVTAPLTTSGDAVQRAKARVRVLLGHADSRTPVHNVVRERFNALLRAEYGGTGQVFDLAAAQSTTADGERTAYTLDGETYYALEEYQAADPGHLNPLGAQRAGSAFLTAIAGAADAAS